MALPTFVNYSMNGSGGSFSMALPADIQTDDVFLLAIGTINEAVSISNQAGGTWTEVPDSPQGTGTAAAQGSTRLTMFWSRYNGTQTAPTVSDSGVHGIAIMGAWRGCRTGEDPFDVTSGGVEGTSDTSVSIPGDTTTVDDCLIVLALSMGPASSGATVASWTNADLSDLTERHDQSTSDGGIFSSIAIADGGKAAAGTYGNTTATTNLACTKGMMSVALTATSSTPPQTLTPDADIATTGWATAPLHSKLVTADGTVITATAS